MDNNTDVITAEPTADSSSELEQTTQDTSYTSAEEQSNTQEVEGEESVVENKIPYDRFQEKVQELNSMREQMAALQAKAEIADRLSQAFSPQVNDPGQVARQRQLEAARQELEQMGYVDKNTVDSLVEEKLQAFKWQQRFVDQMDELSKKYTGADGGPRFVAEEVARFMDESHARGNIITDPEIAFKIMNLEGIAESKAKAQRSSTFSEKPGKAVHAETDKRKSDLDAAAKTGNITEFLKKYGNIPD